MQYKQVIFGRVDIASLQFCYLEDKKVGKKKVEMPGKKIDNKQMKKKIDGRRN